jgi:DNA adenine methylase
LVDVRYLGGKARQAKHIAEFLAAESGGSYWEPFLGGGSVAVAVANTGKFDTLRLSDAHPDLVLMWQAVLDGWVPPSEVSEELYLELKDAEPSALRGFVGFACSFGAKFFGGFARAGSHAWYEDSGPKSHAGQAARSLGKKAAAIGLADDVTVERLSYRDVEPEPGDVMYLDPPYVGTADYSTGSFDSDAFWVWAQKQAESGVRVFVSEFAAPEGWVPVWSVVRKAKLDAHNAEESKKDVESLYVLQGS